MSTRNTPLISEEGSTLGNGGVPPPLRAPTEPHEGSPSIEHTYQELERQLRYKRMREQITLMQAELNGIEVEEPILIDGVPPPSRKRPHTAFRNEDLSRFRPANPPLFKGRSTTELRTFSIEWQNIFRVLGPPPNSDWTSRVNLAGGHLKDKAAQEWQMNEKQYTTWESFIDFLRTVIASPTVRIASAMDQLSLRRQKDKESVRDISNAIREIEQEIPQDLTQDQVQAWRLIVALKPELRSAVLQECKTIESHDQVRVAAERHEGIMRYQYKSEDFLSKQQGRRTDRPTNSPTQGQNNQANPSEADSRARRPRSQARDDPADSTRKPGGRFEGTCNRCGKKGHMIKDCYVPEHKLPRRDRMRPAEGPQATLEHNSPPPKNNDQR